MRSSLIVLFVLATAPAAAIEVVTFPSDDSTAVCNVADCFASGGATELGFFWLASRGDSVEETFSTMLPVAGRAVFDFVVRDNGLIETAEWDVLLNGQVIGAFDVDPNTVEFHLDLSFPGVAGPDYTVRFEMTNDISGGAGSVLLGYAGVDAGALALLGPPDDMQCWQVKDRKAPKFAKVDDLPVADTFGMGSADVKKPSLLCAPASVDGGIVDDSTANLCCYSIKGGKLKPAASVETDDAFGTLQLDVKKAKLLCRPCSETPLP